MYQNDLNYNLKTKIIKDSNLNYKPVIYNLSIANDRNKLSEVLSTGQIHHVKDTIYSQLEELAKIANPENKLDSFGVEDFILKHLRGANIDEYGVWVYYSWNKTLVHLLDESEYIEVRTNRNRNKITREEQEILKDKKIGIVGLSVGQSIALTIATERICGELRLADFDTAELSNLNRIKTGVHNLGVHKTIIAAREIMEIDPFLKVKVYNDGLNAENMGDFFVEGGKLDLFVEVCDGLEVKIESRFKAKELQVPVVMDTNDRGMLDIERFDLEPERDIFHGLLTDFVKDNKVTINEGNRLSILMSIISFDSLSERMKQSMTQINKTINTWPQLASSVVLGGAITTDICRRILLKQHNHSGRFYVDLDYIFNEEK